MDQKQANRRQRGEDFQDEIRRSWMKVPGAWRIRIPDKGGSRPADELILLKDINILAEHKRTESDGFQLSFLRPNQITGLLDFDNCNARNKGLVFVSFLNESECRDECFAFRLADALKFMNSKQRKYIRLDELHVHRIPSLPIPAQNEEVTPGKLVVERAWDLSGFEEYFNKF